MVVKHCEFIYTYHSWVSRTCFPIQSAAGQLLRKNPPTMPLFPKKKFHFEKNHALVGYMYGIYTYIYHTKQPFIESKYTRYTSPMDGMWQRTRTHQTCHHLNHVTSPVADDDQLHILLAGIENDLPCLKMWRGKFLIAKLCNFDLALIWDCFFVNNPWI